MGIGVVYFIRSRKRLGWEDSKLLRHFAIRGALLVFLNMVQTYNWSGSRWMGAESKFATTVLVALGVNFFLSAVVAIASNHAYSAALKKLETRARRRVASGRSSIPDIEGAATRVKLLRIVGLLLLVFALVTLNLLLVPKPTPNGTGFAWWKYMIYLPGQASFFFSIYPPLNWLGLSLYGVAFGYIMLGRKRGPMENISLNVLCGVIFTIAFVVVRVIGGFGNVNPDLLPAPPAGTFLNNPFLTNWQTFFNTIKYPPDYAYSSLYMAINHFSLAAFFLLPTDVVKDTASEGESGSTTVAKLRNCAQYSIGFITGGPLYDYGRCALFFYIIHLPLYGILGWITLQISPESWTVDDGKGGKLLALEKPGFFSVWIVGLFILWALCRWYAGFKARRGPDSVFRFF
ncbi:hypothetical protein BZG36_03947 [Bifiguratus adelaidae]|uniref:Heparan-alpha-glucosaminide N-acetyltransferase catalytic domain-containing protein n=1 Tax=Bifiguratus adelaidae TaxID=1938954 RepID=A0A261XZV6_9FUNG|nr:hypothetical protein BZG36_03947 [Bifiguratus adelaidae]